MRLAGKVVLITGGASGMGQSEAILFAREGARVVVGDVLEAEGRQVVEKITAAGGQARFVTLDSEHSMLTAAGAAAATGVRVFTATSSQGLLHGMEVLYTIAGWRVPLVLVNVSRGLSSPITLGPDHNDVLAARDTGFVQIHCETCQEVLDSVTKLRQRLVGGAQQSQQIRQMQVAANEAFRQQDVRQREEAARAARTRPAATFPTPAAPPPRERPGRVNEPLIDSLDVARWAVLRELFPRW